MLMLDSALEVGKHTVVLIMDEVAPTSSYEDQSVFVEPSTASHEFIWCREQDVVNARERHPGVPVFGVWQVALLNGWVDVGSRISYIRTDIDSGLYLASDGERFIESGRFAAGQILGSQFDLPPISEGREVDAFDTARVVRLPAQGIQTPSERHAARMRSRHRLIMLGAVGAVVVAGIAGAVDFSLALAGERRGAEIEKLKAQTNELIAAALELEKIADPFSEAQRAKFLLPLGRTLEVLRGTGPRPLRMENNFDAVQWTVAATRVPLDLTFPVYLSAIPGAPTVYAFSVTADIEPGPPEANQ